MLSVQGVSLQQAEGHLVSDAKEFLAGFAGDGAGNYRHSNDGTFNPLGYLDGTTADYSAQLLGSSRSWSGITFQFGPVGQQDSAINRTFPLPSGRFSSLKFLGAGVNGNQPSQKFTIFYTDNTSSVVTIDLSDWITAQGYAGEQIVATMAYRDLQFGRRQTVTTHLYGYSVPVDPGKTVARIALPANNNVVVLAMALVP